jgi:HSP20 family molecular chaperone IbpA
MFGKKQICPRCGNKSSKKYSFCPHCGNNFKSEGEFFEPSFNMGFPFNTIFKQLEKQIEKQFREMDKEIPSFVDEEKNFDKQARGQAPKPKLAEGISISISSSGGQPVIRVRNLGDNQNIQRVQTQNQAPRARENVPKKLTEEQIAQFSKLPKEEPQTSVRRLTDRIVYEIDMPGVEEKNVHITKLQNSIEIKAFAKDKAFFKLIPIALPILRSQLSDGKLVLELKPEH